MTTAPMIHMNGTSAENLLRYCKEARQHLNDARTQMINLCPHMRDYYIAENGTDLHRKARAEHNARLTMLDAVLDDIEALQLAIQAQVKP